MLQHYILYRDAKSQNAELHSEAAPLLRVPAEGEKYDL